MPQRRKPSLHHIPAYEDAGLFKNTVAPIDLYLVPEMHRNARQDLVVRGFVQGHQMDVIFAGRRAQQVRPLEMHLINLLSQYRGRAHGGNAPLNIDNLRVPLRVEGTFRPKFSSDNDGWETRCYHYMVARWTMIDPQGNIDVYGAPAIIGRPKGSSL